MIRSLSGTDALTTVGTPGDALTNGVTAVPTVAPFGDVLNGAFGTDAQATAQAIDNARAVAGSVAPTDTHSVVTQVAQFFKLDAIAFALLGVVLVTLGVYLFARGDL